MVINSDYECGGVQLFSASKLPVMTVLSSPLSQRSHGMLADIKTGGTTGQPPAGKGREERVCITLRLGLLPLMIHSRCYLLNSNS